LNKITLYIVAFLSFNAEAHEINNLAHFHSNDYIMTAIIGIILLGTYITSRLVTKKGDKNV